MSMGFEPDVRRDAKRLARQSGFLLGATARVIAAHALRFGRDAPASEWERYDRSIHRAGEAFTDLTCSAAMDAVSGIVYLGKQLPRELPPKSYPRWMFWRR